MDFQNYIKITLFVLFLNWKCVESKVYNFFNVLLSENITLIFHTNRLRDSFYL